MHRLAIIGALALWSSVVDAAPTWERAMADRNAEIAARGPASLAEHEAYIAQQRLETLSYVALAVAVVVAILLAWRYSPAFLAVVHNARSRLADMIRPKDP